MAYYSTDPLAPKIQNDSNRVKYVQFKVFAKIVPDKLGRRMVHVRDLQKLTSIIETDIEEISVINLAEPVAFTPQFGNNPARVTIYGFVAVDSEQYPNVSPTTQVKIIHSGSIPGQPTSVQNGNVGGSTSWGQNVTTDVEDQVRSVKTLIENASAGIDIFFLEYNGVKFGNGYRSFP